MSTLCFRTSIKNTPQLPSGSSHVINGFELPHPTPPPIPCLRWFYELMTVLSADSPELLLSLSAAAHYEDIPREQSYGGNYLFFIFCAGFFFFLLRSHLLSSSLAFKCLFSNYCLALYKRGKKIIMNHPHTYQLTLLVCFESDGRRMYKAKPASHLLFAFCLSAHVSCCCWSRWSRSREGSILKLPLTTWSRHDPAGRMTQKASSSFPDAASTFAIEQTLRK